MMNKKKGDHDTEGDLQSLREENALLKRLLNCHGIAWQGTTASSPSPATRSQENNADNPSTPQEKIALFRRLIGEGFDHPPLDTLILAMPISWKGTLQQYAGRLHRQHAHKHDGRIYDYAETNHPQLARMWAKRQAGHHAMGYEIRPSSSDASQKSAGNLI